MKPQRPYRALRAAVGAIAVIVVLGVWVRSHLVGEPLDMLWQLAALVIVLAGVYAVFGRSAFQEATKTAKDLAGDGDDSDENQ